jgi:hypothetical protein
MGSYLVPTLAGLAFGFGMASVAYLAVFTRALKALHQDNIKTAALLVEENSETAKLLVEGNKARAKEATDVAEKLAESDEVRGEKVQKVEEVNMTGLTKRLDAIEARLLKERQEQEEDLEAEGPDGSE